MLETRYPNTLSLFSQLLDVPVSYRSSLMLRTQAFLLVLYFPIFLSATLFLYVAFQSVIRWILKQRQLRQIPGPEARFLIGNLYLFSQEKQVSVSRTNAYFNVFKRLSQKYQGEGIYKILYSDFHVIVVLCNYETADLILSNSDQIDKSIQYRLLNNWLGESLLTCGGVVWRRKRKILSRVFHNKNLKSFIPVMCSNADKLCYRLTNRVANILPLVLESTLLTVMETTLGTVQTKRPSEKGDDDDVEGTKDYIEALHDYCIHYIHRLSNPFMWIDWLYRFTRRGMETMKCAQRMKRFTQKMINHRIHGTTTVPDTNDSSKNQSAAGDEASTEISSSTSLLLDTLLKYFPQQEVCSEIDTFIFAGHDTVSDQTLGQ